jgi:DNA-binding transcriptional LysR family regulator
MKRNDLNELHAAAVFLQVVQAGSFASAARAIGKSPSTLTRAVAELERHVGAQLLNRSTRHLHLTEAGTVYKQHAELMLAERQRAHEAINTLSGGVPRGHLRVSMPVVVGESLLGPHLSFFHQRYPELHLELDLANRMVTFVQDGFDLALRIGRLADSALRAQRIASVEQVLVANPELFAYQQPPATPKALLNYPLILQRQLAGPVQWSLYRDDNVVRIAATGWLNTSSARLAAQQAIAGNGIARLSAWMVRDALQDGRLIRVLPDWSCHDPREEGVGLHVVYAQGAGMHIPLKSRVFVDFIKEVMHNERV